MSVVLKRVSSDTSAPPSLYGAAGLEAPVSGASRWNDSVDVAIILTLIDAPRRFSMRLTHS